jgi:hypothetical protein
MFAFIAADGSNFKYLALKFMMKGQSEPVAESKKKV